MIAQPKDKTCSVGSTPALAIDWGKLLKYVLHRSSFFLVANQLSAVACERELCIEVFFFFFFWQKTPGRRSRDFERETEDGS